MSDVDTRVTISRIVAALPQCWADLYGAVGTNWPGDRARVRGGDRASWPRPDPEVLTRYRRAEWAIVNAMNTARKVEGVRIELECRSSHWVALAGLTSKLGDYELDDSATQQLCAAERALEPWWWEPRQPRQCAEGRCTNRARRGRTKCSACRKRRERARRLVDNRG